MKQFKSQFLAILLAILFPLAAWAASTNIPTWVSVNKTVSYVNWAWTAHTNGAVSPATSTTDIDGYIFLIVTNPGATAPTNNYDLTITCADGEDILGGNGANRASVASQRVRPTISSQAGDSFCEGAATLNVSNNSVTSATGVVKAYIRR